MSKRSPWQIHNESIKAWIVSWYMSPELQTQVDKDIMRYITEYMMSERIDLEEVKVKEWTLNESNMWVDNIKRASTPCNTCMRPQKYRMSRPDIKRSLAYCAHCPDDQRHPCECYKKRLCNNCIKRLKKSYKF